MTFAEYLQVIGKRWRIWVPVLLAGVLSAVAYNISTPTRFTAVSTSFVTVVQSPTANQDAMFQGSQFAVQRVKSYTSLSRSPDVLNPVIRELGLDKPVRDLADAVEITSPPDTVLLEVAATDSDPSRAAQISNAVSRQLARQIEELETPRSSGVSRVNVTLIEPAAVPLAPSSPRVLVNLILGIVAGAALGFIAALLRHHLHQRVVSSDDIRAVTGMAPLDTIRIRTIRTSGHAPPVSLEALDDTSIEAERYRTVRTALTYASGDDQRSQFVVSSSLPREGKTTVAANLAISWAQAGAEVCVVDADLRRPMLSQALGVEGSVGLSDLLEGAVALDEALIPWNSGMLTLLPAGPRPQDPPALLGSEGMRKLIFELATRFDVIIYDSPSILAVADPVVLSRLVDRLVLVAQAGMTSQSQLARTLEIVREAHVNLVGTVLSTARSLDSAGSHYYIPQSAANENHQGPGRPRPVPTPAEAGAATDAKPTLADAGAEWPIAWWFRAPDCLSTSEAGPSTFADAEWPIAWWFRAPHCLSTSEAGPSTFAGADVGPATGGRSTVLRPKG